MNLSERKLAAKKFMETWKGRGYEKGESQTFWLTLLRDVLGVEHPENIVSFESQVKLSSTSFIDAYISTTKVLIEQKSIDKDLRAPIRQSDGTLLTPFGQAKRYASELPLSMHPRYVVTCNFKSFLVYDMENPQAEPEEVLLENLDREFSRLNFLVDGAAGPFQKELEVSIRAGEHVGEIYDALLPEFGSSPTAEDLHSLNVLCVRLVFCLYAEDAGIFEKEQFYLYLKSFRPENMRMALKDLFLTLDTPEPLRDKFLEPKLKNFPYVNGSLFRMRAEESIPPITEEIAAVLLNRASLNFDWSEISPTIFGAVFESTLNPETRRSGGMHYTSIENIHKVIDPLFLDSFREELEKIKKISGAKKRGAELLNFQRKLGSLKFLDPACGSGNFLTETYLSLRALENEALSLRLHGEAVLDVYGDSIFVHIGQFYGIEINDFAVTVAKTALWIAESQMMEKTSEILQRNLEFLPLKTNANIVEGNALRMDWGLGNREEGTGNREQGIGKREEGTGNREEKFASKYDYIMGNPPFVGARLMNAEQKKDVLSVFGNVKNAGNLDYVSCWYKKTADLLKGTSTKAALVSTNSITQGEQPAILWKPLMQEGIEIDFAWRTFRWDSESAQKAHVHCVIVGFGMGKDSLAMTDAGRVSTQSAKVNALKSSSFKTLGHDVSPHRETVRSESFVPDVGCVNPQKREIYTHGNLPHWHIDGALQFVTFRLADSLPKEKRLELEEMEKAFLKNHPKPWSSDDEERHFKIFGNKIEKYVKAGFGSRCLRFKNIRKIVEEAFFHFDGERYKIHSFVIMPNHVHVLVEPFGQNTLSEIMHSWKSFSAHEIAKVLKSNGSVWWKESFDRLIRDEKHYKNTLEYIKKNPFGLKKNEYSFYSIYEPRENVLLAMTDAGRVSIQSAKVNALKSSPFAQGNESFANFPKSSSFKTLGHDASPHRETVRSDASSPKFIFTESGEKIPVKNINAYLVDAPNVFIESRKKPLCDVPEIGIGNKPIDGGNYLFTEDEMKAFVEREPRSEKYFRKWLGSDEFINGYFRYCLWLGDADPQELVKMPLVMERVKAVRNFRLASKSAPTQKLAETPTRFHVENMPAGNYILIPEVSSEKRRYIPMGFISPNILCSNLVKLIPGATLYHFGVLTSSVHMAWTRAVCGRLKSDYRYSKDIVYNNFPWPDLVISDQGLGIREQGLGIKGGEVYDNEFQRADCLAEGDEPGRRNLSNCQKASERGDLCAFGPDETRRSVDSVEHCGGARQKFNEGIYSISGNSERFCIRTGNSASFMCENKISNGIRSPDSDESAERNSENNQFDDNKTQKQKLEKKLIPDHYSLITETAKAVLTARAKYPNCSLAELYGENMFLFPELEKAHKENDRVVMRAYGFDERMTESEIVAALFEMHRRLVAGARGQGVGNSCQLLVISC